MLVSSTPEYFTMVTILLSREPFRHAQVRAFVENAPGVRPAGEASTVWHPRRPGAPITHPVQSVISLPPAALERWHDRYPYDVSPVRDDAPFFWHFSSFRDALRSPGDDADGIFDPEDAKGERVLVTTLTAWRRAGSSTS